MKFKFLIGALLALAAVSADQQPPPFSCGIGSRGENYAFCKLELPISQRVEDLVSRLTVDEKVSQLVNTAPAIPRLGIPSYQWWSEALHGVAYIASVPQGIRFNGSIQAATSFPQVIVSAASFDSLLWYRIGQAVGKEARAIYNAGQATGMTFWAPNINIYRDPRWGRGQETPGEDPALTSQYSVSYVRGIQGHSFNGSSGYDHDDDDQLQASACCKHFTAYDLDHWKGVDRFVFDAKVTAQDLADTFQPPFHSCVKEGKASGIMCAYNQVNGVPNCADYDLLTTTARSEWRFNGYITSDCDAVSIIFENQTYAKTPEDAVAGVLKAGMDVNCGDYLSKYAKSALQKKKLSEADVDRALHNLFSVRMRLGLFNGSPDKHRYGDIGPDQVCSKQHQELALEAALHGIVLLKNEYHTLPLPKSSTLAVIGPNANRSKILLGNYAGPPCKTVTPLEGLQSYINKKNIMYHPGCTSVQCNSSNIDQAVNIAKGAEQVVLVMGLDQSQEREDHDREELVLPGDQQKLITRVARAAKKPVVLVLLCGGPVDVSFAKNDKNIGSILWAGYPGEAGGLAVAQIIFGDHNPGGRLPVTWYPKEFIKVPMTDMRMRPDPSSGYPGRTYRFYRGPKVFEFGYGLSYSNYSYRIIPLSTNNLDFRSSTKQTTVSTTNQMLVSEIDEETCERSKFIITVSVENQGGMPGKHPVLLFVKDPMKQLVGFQTVKLNPGDKKEIGFELSPCKHFSRTNEQGLMVIEKGSRFLVVGEEEYPIRVVF
ncbi:Probable beta-D-xylosidase 7 [Linum perenne]